ncbi:MAG: polymer-forming cytoskeletal protein [Treponema sp.]|jgi:cytoskeletal protein CcmA (bactofilin family)|nr:polymer-forming cytoskeletal protein [Treponema sp.]
MASVKHNEFSITTIIGPRTNVVGNIEAGGFTRVDGNILGDLRARGSVIIGERARMKSNISGTSITIGGVVYGNVIASERLIILSTGLIIGDIITRRIQADEGCLIHGRVRVCKTEEAWNKAFSEYQDFVEIRDILGLGNSGNSGGAKRASLIHT